MTATVTTKQIKDGAGTIFLQRVLDASGTGAGPFLPLAAITDPDGTGPIDIEALIGTIVSTLTGGIPLTAGSALIGKTVDAGADFQASGVTPVAAEALVVNVRSSSLTPKAGRAAYAWLSGTGTASGFFVFSKDSGTNWFPLFVEGAQLATFTYAKPATLGSQAFAGQLIAIPTLEQASVRIAVIASAVSGTVNVELTA